ncbi:hypothetical protein LP419_35640 [Massilia sp. H-1]|nr:hypothetical protein LP419_35640 [Massilia sp. H-1]
MPSGTDVHAHPGAAAGIDADRLDRAGRMVDVPLLFVGGAVVGSSAGRGRSHDGRQGGGANYVH